ncbi:PREDICTED: uncharacterized protein LOC106813753 isoform X2 [Priapulus caudatus]|uniref:Uncharacterized protein LOC106813753 isoform X2 n=1 Tax=Priapulus caudatus TaxID=37621 RepID=A0ABM1EMN9_PRICU|nr:PREDICTED: uncharacterized protein LOC106813753 isoform X2 [Priapulus caudatus]
MGNKDSTERKHELHTGDTSKDSKEQHVSLASETFKALEARSTSDGNTATGHVSRNVFQEFFSHPSHADFGRLLFDSFQRSQGALSSDVMSRNTYEVAANRARELMTFHNYYFTLFADGKETLGIMGTSSGIGISEFDGWASECCLRLFDGVHAWLLRRLMDATWNGLAEIQLESRSSHLINAAMLWLCSTFLPSCFCNGQVPGGATLHHVALPSLPEWTLLYDSSDQGLSLNRFEHNCFKYQSPTVMLVSLSDDFSFCVATDEEWRESVQRWGSINTIVTQISPKLRHFEGGASTLYLNQKTRGLPLGIQIGSNPKLPILSIDKGMATATHAHVARTLYRIEVWGCGTEADKSAQTTHRQWEAQQAQKERKVKLPGHWDEDNPDMALLEMAGVKVHHSERGDVRAAPRGAP